MFIKFLLTDDVTSPYYLYLGQGVRTTEQSVYNSEHIKADNENRQGLVAFY